jgi:hypothetical protein
VSTPELHWYVAGLGDGATHKGVWLPGGGSVARCAGSSSSRCRSAEPPGVESSSGF